MAQPCLVISSEFPPGPGGIGQHAWSLVQALRQYSNVHVLAHQDYASSDEVHAFNEAMDGAVTVTPFIRRWGKFQLVYKGVTAFRLFRRLRPERVIVTGRFPVWVGGLLKIVYPKSTVVGFAHGSEVTAQGGLPARITYWALRRLDAVWAVSTFTQQALAPANMRHIGVLPNGIDSQLLAIARQPQPAFPWQGDPRLLTVGNLTPRKGQHRVIQSLPAICEQFPGVQYHIVGLPTTKPHLQQLAETLGVANHITFHNRLPKREDLYRAFASADIFIMLSENQPNGDVEGFGIAILEANAFGIPAIGAKGCGIEDAIGPESGILVDGNNHTEITKAIKTILNNYQAYSTGARNWAEQHNWDTLITKIVG